MAKYCPTSLKGKLLHVIKDKLNNLILQQYASEVIEQVYVNSSAAERRDIVISFYGSHFLLLKENSSIPLKELIQTKAKALDGI